MGMHETHGGYANKYFLEMKDLNILNLSGKKYTILHWLTILLQNRLFERRNQISELGRQYLIDHFSIDTSVYDVIKGYRADDSYFSFAQDFLDNTITLKKLSEAMKLGKLGEQIVIISRDGYKHLHYAGAEPVDKDIYYPRKKARDELARSTYFQSRINIELTADDLFLADIIRRGMTANDIHI